MTNKEWFAQAKFGMMIHWGLYSLPAGEWKGKRMEDLGEWAMQYFRIPLVEYKRLAGVFNPILFNAEEWVRLAKSAGMQYMVFTAKHHEGFAMFHSEISKYNIVDATPFGRDVTAELAEGYHRDCFAFPGRLNDEYSKGCNQLIRDNKASLLLSAEDFVSAMGWDIAAHPAKVENVQRSLFLDLSEDEQKVVDILEKQGDLQINTLVVEADIPVQKMNAILFELEMKGVIRVLVGGMYQLLA